MLAASIRSGTKQKWSLDRPGKKSMSDFRSRMRYVALAIILALIVLSYYLSRRSASFKTYTPAGIVRDESGNPIAGACVRFKGSTESVLTDARGHFDLPRGLANDASIITVSREGYVIAGAKPGRSPLEITLSRLPKEDFEDYKWVDPAPDAAGKHNCGNCHAEMYKEWSASAHGR